MIDNILKYWQKFQEFFDINGDAVMLFFTAAVIYRIIHGPPLSPSDAAAYGTCVGAFAATKIKSQ